MDIRDRRLKARLSKWSTWSVETKRGLVKPRKVIMLKRFLSYYKPQMGLFVADTVCALVLAAIDLAFPIILRNLTGGLFTQGQAAIAGQAQGHGEQKARHQGSQHKAVTRLVRPQRGHKPAQKRAQRGKQRGQNQQDRLHLDILLTQTS